MTNAPFFPLSIAPEGQSFFPDAAEQASAPRTEIDGNEAGGFFSILALLAVPDGIGNPARSQDSLKPARSNGAALTEKDSGPGLNPQDSIAAIALTGIFSALSNEPAADPEGQVSGKQPEETMPAAPVVETEAAALQGETDLEPSDPATEALLLSIAAPGDPLADPSGGPVDNAGTENPPVREGLSTGTGQWLNPEEPGEALSRPALVAAVFESGDAAGGGLSLQPEVASPGAAQENEAFAPAQSGREMTSGDTFETRESSATMSLSASFESPDGVRRNLEGRGRNVRSSPLVDQATAEPGRRVQAQGSFFQPVTQADSETVERTTGPGPEEILQASFRPNGGEGSPERSASDPQNLIPEQIHETAIHSNVEKAGAHPLQGASLIRPEAPVLNSAAAPHQTAPAWHPIVERVSGEIAAHVRQNRHEAVIQLEPPELGKLKISLLVQGDTVQARLISETDEAKGMIQTHLPELREALQLHKLDLLRVSVDVGGWSGAAEQWDGRWPSESARQERGEPSLAARKTEGDRPKPAGSAGVSIWA